MARVRTQKGVAGRIDLNYHRRWHRWRVTRVLLVVGCVAAAAGWIAVSSIGRDPRNGGRWTLVDSIHNPGAVARPHAMIEHDCKACHDGTNADGSSPGTGGFFGGAYWKNVSDHACLKCHDGSVHHSNQKMADAHGGVATATFTLAVKDAKHAQGMRSASCITCHTEHRGHDALLGVSNQLCVDCHNDVTKGVANSDTRKTAVRAVAFNAVDHPHFGRTLKPNDPSADPDRVVWEDKTDLKFGHALHGKPINDTIRMAMGLTALPNGDYTNNDCIACHSVLDPSQKPNDLRKIEPGTWSTTPPPYATLYDRPNDAMSSSDKRYTQPISFDRHCLGCHADLLKTPEKQADDMPSGIGEIMYPHEEVKVVRQHVDAAVRAAYIKFQIENPPPKPVAAPAEGEAPATAPAEESAPRRGRGRGAAAAEPAAEQPAEGSGGRRGGRRGGGGGATTPVTPAAWVRAHLTLLGEDANNELSGIDAFKDKSLPAPPAEDAPDGKTLDLNLLVDYYTTWVVANKCYKCHGVTGELPTLDPAANAALVDKALTTTPTNIPHSPRKWFPAGEFDHYAHRQQSCMECHAAAWVSGSKLDGAYKTAAKHVLTADLDGTYPGARDLPVTPPAGTQTCVSCHQPDTSSARFAGDSCITCHWYHDKQFERPISGSLAATEATTRPSAPTALGN